MDLWKRGISVMKKYNFDQIEDKYHDLIHIAREYMQSIQDYEHNIHHLNDVVYYMKELIQKLDMDIHVDVCIVSAYWHDVGRTKVSTGHEKISAQMLKEVMQQYHYDQSFINECCKAIENHKWNMVPETVEGLIIQDADKLAWIGMGRWNECVQNQQRLDSIMKLLPNLRNEILHFDESRKIYDRDIITLMTLLYNHAYGIYANKKSR